MILPRVRDRSLEDKITQQGTDIEGLIYKLRIQRIDHNERVSQIHETEMKFRNEYDSRLSEQIRDLNEGVKLLYLLGKRYSQHRINGLQKECEQQVALELIEKQIEDTEQKIDFERKQRARDLATIIRKAQGTNRHQLIKIRAEQKQKTSELASLRASATLQRETDDKRIDHLSSKLAILTNQCQRLAKAKTYEMQGLASEVSIVKNNLKMLECFIDCGAAIEDLNFIEEVQAP